MRFLGRKREMTYVKYFTQCTQGMRTGNNEPTYHNSPFVISFSSLLQTPTLVYVLYTPRRPAGLQDRQACKGKADQTGGGLSAIF